MHSQDVQVGRVLHVREVAIDNRSRANTGTAIGGAVGFAAAQAVKHTDKRKVARIVGTAGGALAGGAIHNAVTSRRGIEIMVETADRRGRVVVISIVQDNDQIVRAGDQVLLVGRGNQPRVVVMEQSVASPSLSSWEQRTTATAIGTRVMGICDATCLESSVPTEAHSYETAVGTRSR